MIDYRRRAALAAVRLARIHAAPPAHVGAKMRALLACIVMLFCLPAAASDQFTLDIPAQDLGSALKAFSAATNEQVLFSDSVVAGHHSAALKGRYTADTAIATLLRGSDLKADRAKSGVLLIRPMAYVNDAETRLRSGLPAAREDHAGAGRESTGRDTSVAAFRVAQADDTVSPASVQVSKDRNKGAASAPEEASGQLAVEEVVITAQRREETLDKVPISVTALSQKSLDDLHIVSFSDLTSIMPGLVLTGRQSVAQSSTDIAIRGIVSGGNAATTGVYIDETPIVNRQNTGINYSGSPQPDIFDLARVEVLRGPQGTLFGSGAMGGAVRFITPQPNLTMASGYAKAEFSYTDNGAPSYAVGLAYGAPIIEGQAGFRISGWFHSDGGYIDVENPFTGQIVKNNANSSSSYVFRPAFTWMPTDSLTITPAAFIQHHHSSAPNSYWLTGLPNPQSGFATANGVNVEPTSTDDLDVFSLAIKYTFAGLNLQSDTSYTDRSSKAVDDWSYGLTTDFFPNVPPLDPALASFAPYDVDTAWTRAWQQEFRLSSADTGSRVNWVAGLYYRHDYEGLQQNIAPDLTPLTERAVGQTSEEYFGAPDYVLDGQALNSYAWGSTTITQKALFGEVSVNILPRLKANVGVRVERATVSGQNQVYAGPLNGVTYLRTTLPDQSETPITPRAGLTYQYTDDDMVYFTAAKGYRSGGSNTLLANADPLCASSLAAFGMTSAPDTYKSDSLWSYEIGSKNSFFQRRLSFQASAFYIDWTGIQTSIHLPSCGVFFTDNRGKAVSRGFDFQFAAVVTDDLKVTGNFGYVDAYYPSAQYGAPVNGVPPLLVAAGEKLQGIPPWTASTVVDYSRDIGEIWSAARGYLRLDYRWTDALPKGDPAVSGYDSILQTDPGSYGFPDRAYSILNLRLGVTHSGLDLSAFVNNVTNSHPLISGFHWTPTDPIISATAIRPRTFGITALYRF